MDDDNGQLFSRIDQSSAGRWPTDGPQPPWAEYRLDLDELTGDRAVYGMAGDVTDERAITRLVITRQQYQELDRPKTLGIRMQMWHGA